MPLKMKQTICMLCILTYMHQQCSARPLNLQEQNQGKYISFLKGAWIGFETFLALAGYYEDEEVKESRDTGSLIINAEEDEEDQTKIKVVGLGLGRTGTTSVVMALEILGYAVVHDDEQTELTDLFSAAERKEIDLDDFHKVLGLRGYNATFKTADYKWVADHPEVKAILTVRDNADKYVNSWLAAAPFMEIIDKPPFCWMATVDELYDSFEDEYMWETTGGKPDKFLDRDTLRANYELYLQHVQEAIPSERLLTFNAKEGWEPLCEYLGHPVPAGIPFPHVHTRSKLLGEMYFLRLITWIWPLAIIFPLGGMVALMKVIYYSLFRKTKEKKLGCSKVD